MEDIIRVLPDSIANQIAAGEVVQRPASVVKELLENSIDAGSTQIKVIVKDAGKSLVQVIDDGEGMSVTDARLSFERHATSKIRAAQDLFEIKSLGFRGEALASIAAVAQVEMRSKREEDELGTLIRVEGSEFEKQEPISVSRGTSIAVKNLFYNIPARRNFLKSNPVELRHINDEFFRVALSHPDVRFTFLQNDQEIFHLDPGNLSKRIVQLFGRNYQQQLIACEEDTPDIKVKGYLGKPEFSKKTRGEQYFFVNGRFIKNAYLNHAVLGAYEGMIQDDYHPFYILFIEINPKHIDINIHPTKTEVKFDDDRLMYGVIASATRQALAKFNVTPSLDFESDVNFAQSVPNRDVLGNSAKDKQYTEFRTLKDRPSAKNWEMLYQSAHDEDQKDMERARAEGTRETMTFSSDVRHKKPEEETSTLRIHGKYLARQIKSGIVLIDQVAAHERILYERYIQRLQNKVGASQSSLFPQQIELNPSDMSLVTEIKSEIRMLGFEIEEFGKNCIVINGVPPEIKDSSVKEVFEGLIEQYKFNQSRLDVKINDNLARSLSRRTSIKMGHQLMDEEVNELFDQLFACEQPNYTPDGNPTFVVLSLDKIASLFN